MVKNEVLDHFSVNNNCTQIFLYIVSFIEKKCVYTCLQIGVICCYNNCPNKPRPAINLEL